jgi:hypothetical protein
MPPRRDKKRRVLAQMSETELQDEHSQIINKDGTRRQRPPKASRKQFDARVDLAIRMLIMCFSKRDIERAFAERFSISPRSTWRYLSAARKRMRWLADKDHEDCVAEATETWGRRLRESSSKCSDVDKALRECDEKIRATEEVIEGLSGEVSLGPAERAELNQAITAREHAVAQYERLMSQRPMFDRNIVESRREIDRLLGTHAPIKVARTDTAGNDVVQPLNQNEADAELEMLIDKYGVPVGGDFGDSAES